MSLTKITNRLVGSSLKTAISGSDIAESSSFSTRTTALESDSGSFSTRTTALESDSGSFSTRTTTVEGRVNQGVKTTDSPTFAGATINGTLTASEIHTTFVSSSVATITGSNVFGDAVGDLHSFTGSVSISGSQTSLVTAGNVDFNGDLDVDGTTNLDVVDIDGAVDMASTLAVADDITLANNKYYQVKATGGSAIRIAGLANDNNIYLGAIDDAGASVYIREDGSNVISISGGQVSLSSRLTLSNDGSDNGLFLGGGWQIFDNASESYGTAGDLVFYHGASRVVMTDTGEMGIGATSPNFPLTILSADGVNSYTQYLVDGIGTASGDGFLVGYADAGDAYLWNQENTNMIIGTNATQRIKIQNDGDILFGDVGNSRHLSLDYSNGDVVANQRLGVGVVPPYKFTVKSGGAGLIAQGIVFLNNGDSNIAGTIFEESISGGTCGELRLNASNSTKVYLRANSSSSSAFWFKGGQMQDITANNTGIQYRANWDTGFINRIDNNFDGASAASSYMRFKVASGAGSQNTVLTMTGDGNAEFSGDVTADSVKIEQAHLRRLCNLTINDNNVNELAQINQKSCLVYINDSAGGFSSIVLHIGGSGIAYNWAMFDTDSNTWYQNASTVTSTGTNGNTYNFSFNTGNGYIRIQRTNGSLSYDARIYQLFE